MKEVDDWRMSEIRERGFSVRLQAFFTHKYTSDPHDGIVLKMCCRLGWCEARAWQITLFSANNTFSER